MKGHQSITDRWQLYEMPLFLEGLPPTQSGLLLSLSTRYLRRYSPKSTLCRSCQSILHATAVRQGNIKDGK